jgi:hypothetical protein
MSMNDQNGLKSVGSVFDHVGHHPSPERQIILVLGYWSREDGPEPLHVCLTMNGTVQIFRPIWRNRTEIT